MEQPTLPTVEYIIIFDDQDLANELFIDEETALKRIEMVRDNWNCHLFKRVLSV